ncbi:uncharacterized protein LOC116844383 [Odontomachus brunneus]|uniref:uncharacterized protein LOC116844383 n=1 Tax=Odontomachus brunneus TaxID=486640 RepID=UPI0013F194D0|nr:uncharacterized protein LOC116844383 [Odontomachus brunneus]
MSCQLHKALLRYYKQLHSLYDEWLKISKEINISLTALTDQKTALRLISDDADYDEVDIDEELRHRLMFNILMVLDEEQDHLFKVMLQFNHIIQDLANLFHNMIQARSKVSVIDEEMRLLIKGSHCRPKLDLLMQWATKSLEYFNKLYHCINSEVKLLDCNKMKTVDKVRVALKEADKERITIKKILAHTQYMIDEEFLRVKHKEPSIQKIIDPTMLQKVTEQ